MNKPVQADELLDLLQQHLSLSWIYDDSKANEAAITVRPPAAEILQELLEFAQDGELDSIIEIAQTIKTGSTAGFAQAVLKLAETCEIVKLRAFIQQFVTPS